MKLYNMETDEWREAHFKPGDHWRADRVYRCSVCGCESNAFYMWGSTYSHPKLVCPGYNAKSDLHELLREKVQEIKERKHPESYVAELRREIEAMKQQFQSTPPDLEGEPAQWTGHCGHFG
jgi:hypothetical protein